MVKKQKVEKTHQRESEIFAVRVGGETLRTTSEHPFFVKERGWTPASQLKTGDLLATRDGDWVTVHETMSIGETEIVYNLSVAEYRTYFVRCGESSIWVHNVYTDASFYANQPFHYFIRDNETSAILFMGRMSDPTQTENTLAPGTINGTESIDPDSIDPDSIEPELPLPGDADGDGEVGFMDFLAMSENFGKATDAVLADGDFTGDGAIDFADYLVLSENFGTRA